MHARQFWTRITEQQQGRLAVGSRSDSDSDIKLQSSPHIKRKKANVGETRARGPRGHPHMTSTQKVERGLEISNLYRGTGQDAAQEMEKN